VLLDVKRGDIGSTSQAYADAYLDPSSPLAVDAITASPYLGFGSLTPMVETARKHGTGMFVLALTSNPEGAQVQRARTEGGTVADVVLDHLRALNAGAEPLGSFGAVVGATIDGPPDGTGQGFDINGPVLAPGYGAQGGTVDDLRRIFGAGVRHVLPSTSRELLRAGPDRLGTAAEELNERLRELSG
jgi:orotidine-5'-phosphate decarboxylase